MGVPDVSKWVSFESGTMQDALAASPVDIIALDMSSLCLPLLLRFAVMWFRMRSKNQNPIPVIVERIGSVVLDFLKRHCKQNTICVFDGVSPKDKADEAASRRIKRQEAEDFVNDCLRASNGRISGGMWYKFRRKASAAMNFKREIGAALADYLEARKGECPSLLGCCIEPMEADTKIALLAQRFNVLVVSKDGDYLFCPANKLILFRLSSLSNPKANGTFVTRSQVYDAFGLVGVDMTSSRDVYLQKAFLLVLFGGFKNDFQKSRPRSLKMGKWVEVVRSAWQTRASLQHFSCDKIASLCTDQARKFAGSVSEEKWSEFVSGVMRSLNAVVQGIASDRFIPACLGAPTGFIQSSFHEFTPRYVQFDMEIAKKAAEQAIEDAMKVLTEKKNIGPVISVGDDEQRSRKANETNMNIYPRVLAVKSTFNQMKVSKLARTKRNLDNVSTALDMEAFLYHHLKKFQREAEEFPLVQASQKALSDLRQKSLVLGLEEYEAEEAGTWKELMIALCRKLGYDDDWDSDLGGAEKQSAKDYIAKRDIAIAKATAKKETDARAAFVKHAMQAKSVRDAYQMLCEQYPNVEFQNKSLSLSIQLGWDIAWKNTKHDEDLLVQFVDHRLKLEKPVSYNSLLAKLPHFQVHTDRLISILELYRACAENLQYEKKDWEAEKKEANLKEYRNSGRNNNSIKLKASAKRKAPENPKPMPQV